MKAEKLLHEPIRAVNIGLTLLGDALLQQETDAVSIAWRPPRKVSLSPRIAEILRKMDDEPKGSE